MAVLLRITESDYALLQAHAGECTELAVLPRGAAALLDLAHPATEAGLEHAIEVAEDWLMPHARRLAGESLEVQDVSGRLLAGLSEAGGTTTTEWSVADAEDVFLRLVDLATGRAPPPWLLKRPTLIADVLLVRELAHHGRVQGIRFL